MPVAGLEPEGARHPAAARVGVVDVEAEPSEDPLLRLGAEDRVLVAVDLEEGPAVEPPEGEARVLVDHLRQDLRRPGELPRAGIGPEEVRQLVPEHRGAGRLEEDNRDALVHRRHQRVEIATQERAGKVEHPVVVERPAAAEAAPRDLHGVPRALERLDGGDPDLGVEEVGEGVREQHRGLAPSGARARGRRSRIRRPPNVRLRVPRSPPEVLEPMTKGDRREARQRALLRDPRRRLHGAREPRRPPGEVHEPRGEGRRPRPPHQSPIAYAARGRSRPS